MEWVHSRLVPFNCDCDVWLGGAVVRHVRRSADRGTILFTDCRDPLQNAWCDQDKIMAWRVQEPVKTSPQFL